LKKLGTNVLSTIQKAKYLVLVFQRAAEISE